MLSFSNWLKEQQEKKQLYDGLFKPTAFHAKGTSSPRLLTILNDHQLSMFCQALVNWASKLVKSQSQFLFVR